MKTLLQRFISKREHPKELFFSICFFIAYCLCFVILEHRDVPYHLISFFLDQRIPFCAPFVLAYYTWYPYCFLLLIIFFFVSEKDYLYGYRFMAIGMAFFTILNFIYPTGLDLRPVVVPGNGLCATLVRTMYAVDTPTNVFPSLHVYNTIAMHATIINSDYIREKLLLSCKGNQELALRKCAWIYRISTIIAVLIILSTLFIKQHSLVDVIGAFVLAGIVYFFMFAKSSPFRKNS